MGRSYALELARRGARVMVADRGVELFGTGADPALAHDAVAEIRNAGGDACAYTEDLAIEAGARGAARAALDRYGRLDAIVHNAGFTLGAMAFESESLARLDAQLAINTRAAYAIAQEAWPELMRRGGSIVLAGSTAFYGMARSVPYATAKASYIGLVRSLALAGAPHGIRVNAILPSAATRMAENLTESDYRTWFLAHMRVEQVTPVVVALVHNTCPVSGELLVVAGGRIARTAIVETAGVVDAQLTPESALAHLGAVIRDADRYDVADTAASGALAVRVLGGAVEVAMTTNAGEPWQR